VENILVSADIKLKRKNIKKNVSAWLKNPKIGMIPLFMAGDKHFYKVVTDISKQTGIDLDIWLENKLENTHFKNGFTGISPEFKNQRIDALSFGNSLKMPLYYLKNFLKNPSYLNSSLPDTISAFYTYYFEPRPFHMLMFDYVPWDETKLEETLIRDYNWETSKDTNSTWRIGDGTAAFYNYIYYTVCGFSEFDTFRSNQILEGMITREEGFKKVMDENKPRYESIKWYLDTIGLDFERTIKKINQIPKRYL
jgi:glucosamine--fructose-6-phosphate aminotransferase (isomerizing)